METTEAARSLGKLGGSVNSEAQNEARKRNAKLGGRPRGQKNTPEQNARISEGKKRTATEKQAGVPNV